MEGDKEGLGDKEAHGVLYSRGRGREAACLRARQWECRAVDGT